MKEFDTIEDFVAKVDWEGGVLDAMQYGLVAEDIPDDETEDSQKLFDLWNEGRSLVRIVEDIEDILDKYRV